MLKKLINDPEWLNDANLENLSEKILGLEDFLDHHLCNTIKLQNPTRHSPFKRQAQKTSINAF